MHARIGRQGLAERQRDGIRDAARDLPEELAFLETENASPHAIQIDWNHGRRRSLEDLLDASPKRQELSGPGNLPLGKNAHEIPLGERIGRSSQGLDDLSRRIVRRDRKHLQGLGKPTQTRNFGEPSIDDKSDESMRGRHEQEAIHKRGVIGDDQRGPLDGKVFYARHPHAINDIDDQPEEKPKEGLREGQEHEHRGDERHEAQSRKHAQGAELGLTHQEPEEPHGEEHPCKGDQVDSRDDDPLLGGPGLLLYEDVERDDKESAEQTEADHTRQRRRETLIDSRKDDKQDRHSERAHRHETKLRFAPGNEPGKHASRANTDTERPDEITGFILVGAEDVVTVEEEHQWNESRQRPEVRHANSRQPQAAVGEDRPKARGELGERIEFYTSFGRGRRHAADHQTAEIPDHRQDSEHQSRRLQATCEVLRCETGAHGSTDARQKRGELEHTVGSRQISGRHELRHDAVLGRAEERALGSEQEQAADEQSETLEVKARHDGHEDQNLGEFDPDRDAALAESVRDATGMRREEQKREDKDDRRDNAELELALPCPVLAIVDIEEQ